jgi:hypothetical protein
VSTLSVKTGANRQSDDDAMWWITLGKMSAYYKKPISSNESIKMGKSKKLGIDGVKNNGCTIFNN